MSRVLNTAASAVLVSFAVASPTTSAQALSGFASNPDPRLRTVVFAADRVLDVPVRRGQITQIVLGDDEQIVGMPLSGKGANCSDETHAWCIARQGQDLFIKPKTGATSTNLMVVTDRRRHVFVLHPVDGPGLALMRLTVVAPPQPPRPLPAQLVPLVAAAPPGSPAITAQELIDERWGVAPAVRNSAYSVATGKDSDDIVPVLVFDDGTQTYFSFPNNRPLPAVFEVAADGSEEMVNTRMDGDDMLVADRVGRRFVLRLGQSVAAIINDAFDVDGVAPRNGTTVAGVARVLRVPAAGSPEARGTRPSLPLPLPRPTRQAAP